MDGPWWWNRPTVPTPRSLFHRPGPCCGPSIALQSSGVQEYSLDLTSFMSQSHSSTCEPT